MFVMKENFEKGFELKVVKMIVLDTVKTAKIVVSDGENSFDEIYSSVETARIVMRSLHDAFVLKSNYFRLLSETTLLAKKSG